MLGAATASRVNNNRFRSLGTNTTANLCRPWIMDESLISPVVENNYVEAYNCFSAVRGNTGALVQNNRYTHVQDSSGRGAIWLADPDSTGSGGPGIFDLLGARVINNYFELETNAVAVASRCASGSGASNGFIVKDNTTACSGLGCSGALLALARSVPGTGGCTENKFQLCANTTVVNSQVDASAQMFYPATGTGTVSGAGTATVQACPI